MLAARTLMEQGVDVTGLVFVSHFFGSAKAEKAAERLGIELKKAEFKKEHFDMVKNPKYGYGKNMNPCIDCHALMLKRAKKIMESEGYDFAATGEILGQRPMSQNKDALDIVAKESELGDLLVRPMSAQLLDETKPEKEEWISRAKLHGISGRSREKQRELVKKYGITEYSSPGGGCLLTDPVFSQRLMKMLDCWPDCAGEDVELLKNGRVFWISGKNGKVIIVVGRDKGDCEELEKLAQKGDILMELKDITGPITLIRIKNDELRIKNEETEIKVPEALKLSGLKLGEEKSEEEILSIAALLTGYYAKKARGNKVKVEVKVISNK